MKNLLLLSILLLSLPATAQQGVGRWSVRVEGKDNRPLKGASLKLVTRDIVICDTVLSNTDTIIFKDLRPAKYKLVVSMAGHKLQSEQVVKVGKGFGTTFVFPFSAKLMAAKDAAAKLRKKQSAQYSMYPYMFLADTAHISSGSVLVPLRICTSDADSEKVVFKDLAGLKFNEFRSLSFRQFDSAVIKKVYAGYCLNIVMRDTCGMFNVSPNEYAGLDPDSLYSHLFPKGEYGTYDLDAKPDLPRHIRAAFLYLFDNNYIITQGSISGLYFIKKAFSDERIKNEIKTKGTLR